MRAFFGKAARLADEEPHVVDAVLAGPELLRAREDVLGVLADGEEERNRHEDDDPAEAQEEEAGESGAGVPLCFGPPAGRAAFGRGRRALGAAAPHMMIAMNPWMACGSERHISCGKAWTAPVCSWISGGGTAAPSSWCSCSWE